MTLGCGILSKLKSELRFLGNNGRGNKTAYEGFVATKKDVMEIIFNSSYAWHKWQSIYEIIRMGEQKCDVRHVTYMMHLRI